jgi:hypothetical protein
MRAERIVVVDDLACACGLSNPMQCSVIVPLRPPNSTWQTRVLAMSRHNPTWLPPNDSQVGLLAQERNGFSLPMEL